MKRNVDYCAQFQFLAFVILKNADTAAASGMSSEVEYSDQRKLCYFDVGMQRENMSPSAEVKTNFKRQTRDRGN